MKALLFGKNHKDIHVFPEMQTLGDLFDKPLPGEILFGGLPPRFTY